MKRGQFLTVDTDSLRFSFHRQRQLSLRTFDLQATSRFEKDPTAGNNVHIQFGGFGVLIKFGFQYLHLSRGTDFNLVALSWPMAI
jgi:hypothetical protein